MELKISCYCSRCKNHLHLTLQGNESEIRFKRDTYICSDCILKEIEVTR